MDASPLPAGTCKTLSVESAGGTVKGEGPLSLVPVMSLSPCSSGMAANGMNACRTARGTQIPASFAGPAGRGPWFLAHLPQPTGW